MQRIAIATAFLLVLVGQCAISLNTLGGWRGVNTPQPIVSGRHPLHVVHASLGVQSLWDHGTTSCYDPSFQTGYPKTPVFDGGCRPAEFVLMIASLFDRHPTLDREIVVTKFGLLVVCMMVPIVFALSAIGVRPAGSHCVLAAAASCLLWWSVPVRVLFDAGEIDLLLAGLCGVGFCGALAGYHRTPGPFTWTMLTVLTIAGWYSHPLVCLAFFPFAAVYYCSLAPRHSLGWHVGFFGAGVVGFLVNLGWLFDWGRYWWLRRPTTDTIIIPTAEDLAVAGGWGTLPDWTVVGWPLIIAGALGTIVMVRLKARTSAWLFFHSALLTLLLARFGSAWHFLSDVQIERAAILSAGFAIIPAAFGLGAWIDRAKIGLIGLFAIAALPGLVAMKVSIPKLPQNIEPIPCGLTTPQQQFVELLKTKTLPTARIFLEDEITDRLPGWNWTAFLPRLTERAFIGGLDFGPSIESMSCPMKNRMRFRGEFGVDDALAVIERYNVGWVVCRTQESTRRWSQFPGAKEIGRVGDWVLIAIDRTHNFIIRGSGILESADAKRIIVSNLVPDSTGCVTISMHYQPGMRTLPATAQLEPDHDPFDVTPMLRLRMTSPVSRLTIIWENP